MSEQAEVKMLADGLWNISGEHKALKKGEIYKLPVRCAKEICDNEYGEYIKEQKKPAPEEKKAIVPEENKAVEPEEKKKKVSGRSNKK